MRGLGVGGSSVGVSGWFGLWFAGWFGRHIVGWVVFGCWFV